MAKLMQDELKKMMPEKRKAYEKKKKKVERNRKILGMFLCVTIMLVTVLVLSLTVFFKIDTITVRGDSIYEESQIVNASGVKKGSNLFLCDLQEVSQGICKNLPYVAKANVKRKIPSTIIIEISPSKAYIAVKTASGTALADKNGKVLELVSGDSVSKKVIKLNAGTSFSASIGESIFDSNKSEKAEKKQKEKAESLEILFEAIGKSGLKNITEIDIKSASDISITYQDRLKLNLGSVNDIEYKLKSAVEIIKKENEINPKGKGEVFLSDPDNIYVSSDKN